MPVRWIDPSLAENNKVKAEKDKYDVHFVINSSGLLAQFNQAEIIDAADVHLADRLAAKYGEKNEAVILAVALAARAVRHGSPAVDLAGTKQHYFDQLTNKLEVAWPGDDWYQQVKASHLVKAKAIRVLDQAEAHENATGIVYLNRYWHDEVLIADTIKQRLAVGTDSELTTDQNKFLQNLLPDPQAAGQIAAVKRALEQATTVITGGPGTGKTTTLGALLAMLAKFAPEMQVALAAPTGKAAKRMNEAILEALSRLAQPDVKVPKATTINRLLGPVAGSATRFQHNVSNPLPFDIIIIDEASMVSLIMMARIMEAIRPETKLILVGDKDQLASVDAGNILGDIIAGTESHHNHAGITAQLTHNFRTGKKQIQNLAGQIVSGDDAAVIELLTGHKINPDWGNENDLPELAWQSDITNLIAVKRAAVKHGKKLQELATDNAAAALNELSKSRILCANRHGVFGVSHWNRVVAQALGVEPDDEFYLGRQILVTANDYGLGLSNGDTGVVISVAGQPKLRQVAFDGGLNVPTTQLSNIETAAAMTIHKSQGSEADHVMVILPDDLDSPLLTRELLYTAVTRAKESVLIVGTEAAIRKAVTTATERTTGLAQRLSAFSSLSAHNLAAGDQKLQVR